MELTVTIAGIKALASEQGKELFYSIGTGGAIGLLTFHKYRELSKDRDRTIMEDIAYKAMRDAMSIYGVFDPTLWSGVRVADFIEDVAIATKNLIFMDRYVTTGELKGLKQFEKIITPPILRRIINEGDEPVRTSASKLRGKSRLEELRGGGGTGVNRPSGTELERGKSRLEELRRQ